MASSSRSTQRLSLAFFSDINQLRRCPAQASEAAITNGVLGLAEEKQRKYILGAFTETCSPLFLGTRDRRASGRHGKRSNANHRISR